MVRGFDDLMALHDIVMSECFMNFDFTLEHVKVRSSEPFQVDCFDCVFFVLFSDLYAFINFAAISTTKHILNGKLVITYSHLTLVDCWLGWWNSFLGSTMSECRWLKSISLAMILLGQISHVLIFLLCEFLKFSALFNPDCIKLLISVFQTVWRW